jgi:hypothetical protein
MNTKKILGRSAAIGLLILAAPFALAQTASTTDTSGSGATTTDTSTPGAPNTGAGGDAATAAGVLALSAAAAIGGAVYLSRKGAFAH